jgi:glycosyltransferase involved in cell wall biosynthesis
MRILMLSRVLPPHGPGGLAAAAWDLAGALGAAGAEVDLLTTAGGASQRSPPGVRVRALPAPAARYSGRWWRETCRAFAEGPRYQAVLGVSAAAHALVRLPPPRPVLVFQAHGTALGEAASKLRARRLRALAGLPRQLAWAARDRAYRRYDAVAAVGEAVRQALARWPTAALVGRTPVRLLPNGVDERAFAFRPSARGRLRERLQLAPDQPLILFAGRWQADKGVAAAVEVLRRVRRQRPDARLAVLGDGPERTGLERAARREPALLVHGPVDRADLPDWLSAADALLLPTRRAEGLPLIVLEALACGLPVVTTAAGAMDADLPCLRCAPADVEAMAAALLQVVGDRTRASRLPAAFTLEASATRYLALFEALLRERGA